MSEVKDDADVELSSENVADDCTTSGASEIAEVGAFVVALVKDCVEALVDF